MGMFARYLIFTLFFWTDYNTSSAQGSMEISTDLGKTRMELYESRSSHRATIRFSKLTQEQYLNAAIREANRDRSYCLAATLKQLTSLPAYDGLKGKVMYIQERPGLASASSSFNEDLGGLIGAFKSIPKLSLRRTEPLRNSVPSDHSQADRSELGSD